MTQQLLTIFSTVQLKQGKAKCPVCERMCRAYAKTLDERLVNLGLKCLKFCLDNNRKIFRFEEVVINKDMTKQEARRASKDVADLQKLHYWNIIEKTDKATFWRITEHGMSWLFGNGKLPEKVWVFGNERLRGEDWERGVRMVSVDEVSKRWQVEIQNYRLDYRYKGYKGEVQQTELLPT